MRCPKCKDARLRVMDSRETDEGIRRRRKCDACGAMKSTVELDAAVVRAIFQARKAIANAHEKIEAAQGMLGGLVCEEEDTEGANNE